MAGDNRLYGPSAGHHSDDDVASPRLRQSRWDEHAGGRQEDFEVDRARPLSDAFRATRKSGRDLGMTRNEGQPDAYGHKNDIGRSRSQPPLNVTKRDDPLRATRKTLAEEDPRGGLGRTRKDEPLRATRKSLAASQHVSAIRQTVPYAENNTNAYQKDIFRGTGREMGLPKFSSREDPNSSTDYDTNKKWTDADNVRLTQKLKMTSKDVQTDFTDKPDLRAGEIRRTEITKTKNKPKRDKHDKRRRGGRRASREEDDDVRYSPRWKPDDRFVMSPEEFFEQFGPPVCIVVYFIF